MKKGKGEVVVILFFIILLYATPAMAKKAYLSELVVSNTKDHLQVFFGVNDCFTPEMNTAIESGIATTFTFFIRLFEKRYFWWDLWITDIKVSHAIKYDSLKKIYELRLSEKNNETVQVADFEEAKKLMAEVVALKIIPLQDLEKGRTYKLKMMAQLDKIKLPLYLHYFFFFLSLWDFETDWYTSEFTY